MGDGIRPKNLRSYAIERYPELKAKLELEKQAQKQIITKLDDNHEDAK